jgi:hypothetical protein
MKKLLLTGVAALSVLTASAAPAASSQAPKVELPDRIVGLWCYAKDISTDTERHYLDPYGEGHSALDKDGDPTWIDACGDEKYSKESDASIEVWKKGHKSGYVSNWVAPGYRNFCTFDKIEAVKGSETTKGAVTPAYSVHANCRSGWGDKVEPPWTENLELQIINDELVITELPEG